MTTETMTLEQALDADFDTYINWCHDYCRRKSAVDPIFADVWNRGNQAAIFQALWAKRYWFHKCGAQAKGVGRE